MNHFVVAMGLTRALDSKFFRFSMNLECVTKWEAGSVLQTDTLHAPQKEQSSTRASCTVPWVFLS